MNYNSKNEKLTTTTARRSLTKDGIKAIKGRAGDCNVPQMWKDNVSLGRWVDNQKTQHQKLYCGKPTHLTIERIQLLVQIGFNWRRAGA
jgi:hypothetical protein